MTTWRFHKGAQFKFVGCLGTEHKLEVTDITVEADAEAVTIKVFIQLDGDQMFCKSPAEWVELMDQEDVTQYA